MLRPLRSGPAQREGRHEWDAVWVRRARQDDILPRFRQAQDRGALNDVAVVGVGAAVVSDLVTYRHQITRQRAAVPLVQGHNRRRAPHAAAVGVADVDVEAEGRAGQRHAGVVVHFLGRADNQSIGRPRDLHVAPLQLRRHDLACGANPAGTHREGVALLAGGGCGAALPSVLEQRGEIEGEGLQAARTRDDLHLALCATSAAAASVAHRLPRPEPLNAGCRSGAWEAAGADYLAGAGDIGAPPACAVQAPSELEAGALHGSTAVRRRVDLHVEAGLGPRPHHLGLRGEPERDGGRTGVGDDDVLGGHRDLVVPSQLVAQSEKRHWDVTEAHGILSNRHCHVRGPGPVLLRDRDLDPRALAGRLDTRVALPHHLYREAPVRGGRQ
mmetsp:Transcript_41158/g.132450  ORF Transcript_41158/g.132450 Transcript_41158/m.132450 type:complete len:385 (+) Transcript_41158:4077-5231(+)